MNQIKVIKLVIATKVNKSIKEIFMLKKSIRSNPQLKTQLDNIFAKKKSIEEKLLDNIFVKLLLGIAPIISTCSFLACMIYYHMHIDKDKTLTEASLFFLSFLSCAIVSLYYIHLVSVKIKSDNKKKKWICIFYTVPVFSAIVFWYFYIWNTHSTVTPYEKVDFK